jgi:hypothetical protein
VAVADAVVNLFCIQISSIPIITFYIQRISTKPYNSQIVGDTYPKGEIWCSETLSAVAKAV